MAERETEPKHRHHHAELDAQIYTTTTDPELDDEAYIAWANGATNQALADLDLASDDHPPA